MCCGGKSYIWRLLIFSNIPRTNSYKLWIGSLSVATKTNLENLSIHLAKKLVGLLDTFPYICNLWQLQRVVSHVWENTELSRYVTKHQQCAFDFVVYVTAVA